MTDKRAPRRVAAAAILLIGPALITLARTQDNALAHALNEWVTLAGATGARHEHLQHLLFVPLSAVVVAMFRLTLGLRVLGLFRPILLAVAFHLTGIVSGLLFLALSLAVVATIHPTLRGTHSFARLTIVLTLVSALLVLGGTVQSDFVSVPVVALCLTSEAFANTLHRRGMAEALARTVATILAAAVIALVASVPGFFDWLLARPEMLAAEVGAVLVIDGWLNLRLVTTVSRRVAWAPLRLMALAAESGGTD